MFHFKAGQAFVDICGHLLYTETDTLTYFSQYGPPVGESYGLYIPRVNGARL
jgi:hypothetical protein